MIRPVAGGRDRAHPPPELPQEKMDMTSNRPARHTRALQPAHTRQVAAVDNETARGVHRVRTQISKETAAVQVLFGVGAAADRLPADLPDRHRRTALRIASTTARLIERLTR